MDMPARQPRRREQPAHLARDLTYITARGGRRRRHRYLQDMRVFVPSIVLAIAAQGVVYSLVFTQPGRSDWVSLVATILVLAFVPMVAAALLTGFRRNEAPIMVASVVSLGVFSVAVSALSALRVPLSYSALAMCLPVVAAIIVHANIRFHRSIDAHAALAPFRKAKSISRDLGNLPILSESMPSLKGVEVLLVDPHEHHREEWAPLLAKCYLSGVEIMPWTRYLELQSGRLDIATFDISHLSYSPGQLLYARCKRWLDVFAVVVTMPITLPLAALTALYIYLLDGGPVFFVQLRRGFGGRRFRMYKFRTMRRGTGGGATQKGDKRIIPGCGLIRKLHLDELPQLFNILLGDMSLIGPRPEAIDLSRSYEKEIDKYVDRLLVLPGVTGWAQVNTYASANVEEAKTKLSYDLYYIKHLSLDLDLLILFKTVGAVLFRGGAH